MVRNLSQEPNEEVTENGLHPDVEAEIVRRINDPDVEWVTVSLAQLHRELLDPPANAPE